MEISHLSEPMKYIRQNSSLFIPTDSRPIAEALLLQLISDALALQSDDLAICRFSNWFYIGSDSDWLQKGLNRPSMAKDLFYRIYPLVEAGPNSIRHEVVVNAFADQVALFGPEGVQLMGRAEKDVCPSLIVERGWALGKRRVVAFVAGDI